MATANIESEMSSEESSTKLIDSTDDNQTQMEESPVEPTTRTAIGAKLVKKLETFGMFFFSSPFERKNFFSLLAANSNKTSSATETATDESDSSGNVSQIASMP